VSLGRFGASQSNQFGFLLAIKYRWHRRCRPLFPAQHRLKTLLRQLFAYPVDHGHARLQSLDDPAVTPPFAGFGDIGLQQDLRLQKPSRWALSFSDQRFELLALVCAQPHNISLYRVLLRSHDSLRRHLGDASESAKPFKLIEATD